MVGYLVVALIAASVTALATFALLRVARRFRLAPKVRARDVHTTPTPRLGGIAMFAGILVAFAFASTQDALSLVFADAEVVWAILAACALIVGVGVLDDLFDLDWMIKLGVQLLAAGLLAWQGVQIVSLPIGDALVVGSPLVNFVLTVFILTLMMNAVNFIDGLDGLVAGVALISNAVFFIYTLLLVEQSSPLNQFSLASLIAIALVGVTAGFLPFNWHRAKMFMGDTGSLLIGLLMATSTIAVTGQLSPSDINQQVVLASYIPIILPIAVLIVPLLDFSLAVIRRVQAGKSPFTADRKHLHHRLLDMGHSQVQAVLIFYLWTAVLSVGFLLVFVMQSYVVPMLVILIGGIICGVVTIFPFGSRKRNEILVQKSQPDSATNDVLARLDPLDSASTQPIPVTYSAEDPRRD
jgi:UDP-GlcNAc:undecaprenyl-phosphate GlcNAc-1-phosphate transferase